MQPSDLTYSYYTDEYLGNLLDETTFNRILVQKAFPFLSARVFDRLAQVSSDDSYYTSVCNCLCNLCEIYNAHTSANGSVQQEVSSESVGSWHRTYKTSSDSTSGIEVLSRELSSAVQIWLADTGLLYAGVI